MIEKNFDDAKVRMDKSIESLKTEFKKIRSGRANPSLLDQVSVNYYGNNVPLSQVATVAVEDARMLTVTPWEKTMLAPIEKAIMTSDLGLNPATTGMLIRVALPALTEQRRLEMVKIVKSEAENAKIAMRNIRRDANTHVKTLLKNKEISKDDDHRAQERVQKLTDEYIKKVDSYLEQKEKELLEV